MDYEDPNRIQIRVKAAPNRRKWFGNQPSLGTVVTVKDFCYVGLGVECTSQHQANGACHHLHETKGN